MILAEVHEYERAVYLHYPSDVIIREANDIFGYAKYLSLDLFLPALNYIVARDPSLISVLTTALVALLKHDDVTVFDSTKDVENFNFLREHKAEIAVSVRNLANHVRPL